MLEPLDSVSLRRRRWGVVILFLLFGVLCASTGRELVGPAHPLIGWLFALLGLTFWWGLAGLAWWCPVVEEHPRHCRCGCQD